MVDPVGDRACRGPSEKLSRAVHLPALVALVTLAGTSLMVGCGGSSSGGVLPGTVTILNVQTQVFTPRCAVSGCHVGTTPPFDLNLSSVALSAANTVGVVSAEVPAFLRVEPGNAADSYLFMKLIGDARITGDPMPAEGGSLSASEIALVESWIDQGAN